MSNTADNQVDHEPMVESIAERAKEILSQMLSELKPGSSATKEPTILITGVADEEMDPKEDKVIKNTALQLTVDIPKISISSEEDELQFSHSSGTENSQNCQIEPTRPSSLVAVVRPMSKCGYHEDTFTLDTLPSPNDFQRSGSIVGEPHLPVPTEFRDMQETSDDEEARKVKKSQKKVSFNIASEASYVYILIKQRFIENVKSAQFWRVFDKLKLVGKQCYIPDRSILIGQQLVVNAKIETFWLIFTV